MKCAQPQGGGSCRERMPERRGVSWCDACRRNTARDLMRLLNEPEGQLVDQLIKDNRALARAGNHLAAAAIRVTELHDGVHRLRLATAQWATAMANEGGRGDRYA